MVTRAYGTSFTKCYNMLSGENRCCVPLGETKYNMLHTLSIKSKKKRTPLRHNNSLKVEIEQDAFELCRCVGEIIVYKTPQVLSKRV